MGNSIHLKRLAIATAVCLVVAAMLGLLTGCGESSEKYVGTWDARYDQKASDGLTYHLDYTFVIAEDKTWNSTTQQTGRLIGTNYGTTMESGKWQVNGGVLILSVDGSDVVYKMTLSEDETMLRSEAPGENFVLHKR